MERVQVLIDKLVQQRGAGESAAQLLYTVQLLQTELTQMQQQKETFSSRKVSVVMPANFAAQQQEVIAVQAPPTPVEKPAPIQVEQPAPPQKEIETFVPPVQKVAEVERPPVVQETVSIPVSHQPYQPKLQPPVEEPSPQVEKEKTPTPQKDLFGNEAYTLRRPTQVQPEPKEEEEEIPQPIYFEKIEPVQQPAPARPPAEPQPFDALAETPTLLQHIPPQVEAPKEINQLIAQQHTSLNDRLKEEKIELAHKLKDTPIKDLRKAIGINDRFEFVSELFRGDEAMYERSIKTINSFHILGEAEYWMNRELKVKLGWNDNKDTVQHFYGLVRRRFS